MRDPQLAEGWKEGYKWYFCGPCKQFMEEMTGWFQETNVRSHMYADVNAWHTRRFNS